MTFDPRLPNKYNKLENSRLEEKYFSRQKISLK